MNLDTGVVAIVISAAGFGLNYLMFVVKQNERIARVEVKGELFWKLVEQNISELVKSPTHIYKDNLLDKIKDGSINKDEAAELHDILKDELEYIDKKDPRVIGYILVMSRLDFMLRGSLVAKGG